MITFTQLGEHGRLGNQLFQYAALKAAALRNGYECKIPDPQKQHWHGQDCLLNQFNIEASYLQESDIQKIKNYITDNNVLPGTYSPVLEQISDNTDLFGFFQNTKYFADYSKQIISELTPQKKLVDWAQNRLNKLRDGKRIVSLHIRRGDQTDGTNPEYVKHYGSGPFDLSCNVGRYIVTSLSEFNDCNVLVFVGGSRSGNDIDDIKWAQNYFSDDKFIVSQTNNPLQDFALMSQCDHNIISFASSFGWWAAYINPNPEKIIIAPKDYHLDGNYNSREGFYPINWKII